jgi:hypothetical protein
MSERAPEKQVARARDICIPFGSILRRVVPALIWSRKVPLADVELAGARGGGGGAPPGGGGGGGAGALGGGGGATGGGGGGAGAAATQVSVARAHSACF